MPHQPARFCIKQNLIDFGRGEPCVYRNYSNPEPAASVDQPDVLRRIRQQQGESVARRKTVGFTNGYDFGYFQPEALFDPAKVPADLLVHDTAKWVKVADRGAHASGLKLLATVAGPEPVTLDALAALLMGTALSNPADVPDVVSAKVIDRRRSYPIPSVTLNRDAHPAVSRSRITIKADAAEQLFAIDTSNITWAVIDSGIDMLHPAFAERDEADKPIPIGAGPMPRTVPIAFSTYSGMDIARTTASAEPIVVTSAALSPAYGLHGPDIR
jgi:hypothetical protein